MYSAETHDAPLPMLRSPDLDATVAAVNAAGGTIVEPPYDYPGGRRFSFTDPSGNRLAVYSRRSDQKAGKLIAGHRRLQQQSKPGLSDP